MPFCETIWISRSSVSYFVRKIAAFSSPPYSDWGGGKTVQFTAEKCRLFWSFRPNSEIETHVGLIVLIRPTFFLLFWKSVGDFGLIFSLPWWALPSVKLITFWAEIFFDKHHRIKPFRSFGAWTILLSFLWKTDNGAFECMLFCGWSRVF